MANVGECEDSSHATGHSKSGGAAWAAYLSSRSQRWCVSWLLRSRLLRAFATSLRKHLRPADFSRPCFLAPVFAFACGFHSGLCPTPAGGDFPFPERTAVTKSLVCCSRVCGSSAGNSSIAMKSWFASLPEEMPRSSSAVSTALPTMLPRIWTGLVFKDFFSLASWSFRVLYVASASVLIFLLMASKICSYIFVTLSLFAISIYERDNMLLKSFSISWFAKVFW